MSPSRLQFRNIASDTTTTLTHLCRAGLRCEPSKAILCVSEALCGSARSRKEAAMVPSAKRTSPDGIASPLPSPASR
jgi:hypothetical protein